MANADPLDPLIRIMLFSATYSLPSLPQVQALARQQGLLERSASEHQSAARRARLNPTTVSHYTEATALAHAAALRYLDEAIARQDEACAARVKVGGEAVLGERKGRAGSLSPGQDKGLCSAALGSCAEFKTLHPHDPALQHWANISQSPEP